MYQRVDCLSLLYVHDYVGKEDLKELWYDLSINLIYKLLLEIKILIEGGGGGGQAR